MISRKAEFHEALIKTALSEGRAPRVPNCKEWASWNSSFRKGALWHEGSQ
jgi:hypothetical protein